MKMVILLTHGSNDDRSSVCFTMGNASLDAGNEVAVFMASDGVYCSKSGYPDHTHVPPFKPLGELVDSFVAKGGQLWACIPCVEHRGLSATDLRAETTLTDASLLLEWLGEGARSVSL